MKTTKIDGINYSVENFGHNSRDGRPIVTLAVIGKSGRPTKRERVGTVNADGSINAGTWLRR